MLLLLVCVWVAVRHFLHQSLGHFPLPPRTYQPLLLPQLPPRRRRRHFDTENSNIATSVDSLALDVSPAHLWAHPWNQRCT